MRQKRFILLILLLVGIIAVLLWRYVQPEKPRTLAESVPITSYTLAGGLKLLVVENHRVPAVSHTLFVRAGGADDPPGKSGLAHYAEHMMFKGTANVPEGEYDRRIAALGGEANAYTTSDFTAYYVNAPASALEQVMALESDRFLNLRVDAAAAETERKVVLEERKLRVESDPASLLSEQMDAVQYLIHPYRMPVIGWAGDIESFTPADISLFFNTHYTAPNMVLVVAGDVEPKAVRKLAMRYFGGLRKDAPPSRAWGHEPPAIVARTVTLQDARVRQAQWIRTYPAASIALGEAQDAITLELVAQWLGGGRTGLLYQALVVKQKLAVDAAAYYDGTRSGPGQFTLRVIPADGVTQAQIEAALAQVLESALGTGPDAESLTRAQTLYLADVTFARDGLRPIASYIGTLAMVGKDPGFFYGLEDAIRRVTADDMRRVAQATLLDKGSVTGMLLPESPVAEAAR